MSVRTWLKFAAALLFAAWLTSCSFQADDRPITEIPERIKADLTVHPKALEPGQPVTLEVKVFQGENMIDDADEVVFEIWKSGHKEKAERFEAIFMENGRYALEQTIEEEGVYYVTCHVTVGGLQMMPTEMVIVGDAAQSDLADAFR